jgi:dolichol-phosphate mannosyltransferase
LPALFERLDEVVKKNPQHRFEFICVDDGSGDDSFQVLENQARENRQIKLVKLSRNFGEPAATYAGMTYATGDALAVIAADLQDPPEDLNRLIAEWEQGHKVVLAIRKDRHGDPFLTRAFALIFNILFKLVYKDFSPQGIGFFLIDKQVVNVLLQCEEKNTHPIGLILWTGYPYKTIVYDRPERKEGKSKWNFGKKN